MDQSISRRVHTWMFESALPLWGTVAIDREFGGYIEQLTLEGRPAAVDFKRVRVISRQIYVFSHAYLLGWAPGLELARHGYDFLTRYGWLGEDFGWARTLAKDGSVIDATADLYDSAFCLFALSWFRRASGYQGAQQWAMKTIEFIDQHMRHPSGIGFHHWKPTSGHRQQNPHMHLLEACLASFEAEADDRSARMAKEVAGLFETKFFDLKTRTLAEFFDEDFNRASGPEGRMIEPGHQFEWAWILVNLNRLLGVDLSDHARALIAFGEEFGVDKASFTTYDGVWDDGSLRLGSSRSWPNTERIKAAVALYELDKVDPCLVFSQSAGLLLNRYLNIQPHGIWIDQYDQQGAPLSSVVPTSTLYHIFLAFSELLRVSGGEA
jgi:mannose/cellobiose epimerase-like protein (N-acyl-D-glucosamine 2-epimerase family)